MRDTFSERVAATDSWNSLLWRVRPWLALVVGFTLAFSLSRHRVWPDADVDSFLESTFLLVYLGALFALIAYLLLARLVFPALAALPRQQRRRLLVVTLLVGLTGTALLLRQPTTHYELEIVATGQKQAAAQGSEVWIQGIYRGDGSQVPANELTLGPGWELREGVPLSHQGQPATLRWQGASQGDVIVRLVSHPWSGIVTLRWNGQEQSIDLFSASATTYETVLPTSGTGTGRLLELLGLVADTLGIAFLALVLGVWLIQVAVPSLMGGQRRLLTLTLLMLLALVLSPPVAVLIGPAPTRLVDHLAAWGYMTLLMVAIVALLTPGEWLLALIPERWPHSLRWLGVELLGQARGVWLLATLACGLLAMVLVGRLGLGGEQHAVWARLALDAPGDTPPEVVLRYGPGTNDIRPVSWQPYATTNVALRPVTVWREAVPVLAIKTDQGPLRLDAIAAAGGKLENGRLLLYHSDGALLSWPQSSQALTITLGERSAAVELLWLDQAIQVEPGVQPTQVTLQLPAKHQGWVLLPAEPIESLAIELPPRTEHYQIQELAVLSASPQSWHGNNPADWFSHNCALRSDTQLTIAIGHAPCTVEVIGEQPLNPTKPWRSGIAWALLTTLLLSSLWLLARGASVARRVLDRHNATEKRLAWQRDLSEGVVVTRILWPIWIAALIFQFGYALIMPISYTNDSLGYYELGQQFMSAARFADVQTVRTPGYPLFMGMVVTVFGDTAFWIVMAQHLALSLLAPLTAWTLWSLVGQPGAILAGLAAGVAPAMAAAANILWTESLFSVLTATALLLVIARGASPRGLLLAGVIAGLATMVRPTGLLVVVAVMGWLLLSAWCADGRSARQRAAMLGATALVVGYLTTAGLWHLHLALVYRTTDLSRGHAGFTAWAMSVYQRQIGAELPINRPDRAIWAVPLGWDYDVFNLINSNPQLLTRPAGSLQDFYGESQHEAQRFAPQQVRNSVQTALLYNLTLQPLSSPPEQSGIYIYWSELSDIIWSWRTPKPPPDPSGTGIEHQMALMAYRWQPLNSLPRSALIDLSLLALKSWALLGPLLLLSIVLLLLERRLHTFVPAWLFWLGLVLSSAAISTPAERYIAVAEPIAYTLLIVAAVLLTSIRYRRLAPRAGSDATKPQIARAQPELRETEPIIRDAP